MPEVRFHRRGAGDDRLPHPFRQRLWEVELRAEDGPQQDSNGARHVLATPGIVSPAKVMPAQVREVEEVVKREVVPPTDFESVLPA
jgi:hypothetical protein